jgi:CHRD domain
MRSRFGASLVLAAVLSLLGSLALAGVALAAETRLSATLAGVTEGENPGDPDGSGSAAITLDPETGEACWELSAEGIGAVMQSHVHVGGEGESGDVVVPLDVDGFEGTSEGCASDQEADVLQAIIDDPAGYYVNLHTEEFPAGAIRGQLAAGTPNTAMSTSSTTLVAFVGAVLLGSALAAGLRAWRPIATRD